MWRFQSTLPVGGATLHKDINLFRLQISIHAPRGGSDLRKNIASPAARLFQSTLPVGGATWCFDVSCCQEVISIHAPRGGSDCWRYYWCYCHEISIHAPRGGSDPFALASRLLITYFNPRSPWGERRLTWKHWEEFCGISIHAPRGGSDSGCFLVYSLSCYFNPRSPWGERLHLLYAKWDHYQFQSTLPVGGATTSRFSWARLLSISIHAPRGGSDAIMTIGTQKTTNFNPRSPWGERLYGIMQIWLKSTISIHAPRGGSDITNHIDIRLQKHFNPRSPWGERQQSCDYVCRYVLFQSTLPVGGATDQQGN